MENIKTQQQGGDDEFYREFEQFLEDPTVEKLSLQDNDQQEEDEQQDIQVMDVVINNTPATQPTIQPQPSTSGEPTSTTMNQPTQGDQQLRKILSQERANPPLVPRITMVQQATMPMHIKLFVAGRNPSRPVDSMDTVPIGVTIIKMPTNFFKHHTILQTLITIGLRIMRAQPPYNWAFEAKVLKAADPHIVYYIKNNNEVSRRKCYPTTPEGPTIYPCIYRPDATTPHHHAKVQVEFSLDFGCEKQHRFMKKPRSEDETTTHYSEDPHLDTPERPSRWRKQIRKTRRETSSESSDTDTSTSSSSTTTSSSSSSTTTSTNSTRSDIEEKQITSSDTSSASNTSSKRARSNSHTKEDQKEQKPNKRLLDTDLRYRLTNRADKKAPKKNFQAAQSLNIKKRIGVVKKDPFQPMWNGTRQKSLRQQQRNNLRHKWLRQQQQKYNKNMN
jgi:hypothetical protein